MLIGGDFNARCGDLVETESDSNTAERIVVDKVINTRGRDFISFANSLDLVLLNGRFDESKDGFTSVSTKGLAVVDYFICPSKSIDSFSNFKVTDPLETIHNFKLDVDSSLPDHRILEVKLETNWMSKVPPPKEPFKSPNIKKIIPENYMTDDTDRQALSDLTCKLNDQQNISESDLQCHVNEVYKEFCSLLDSKLIKKKVSNRDKTTKQSHQGKAWWSIELSSVAKEVRKCLKNWEKDKGNPSLKKAYLSKQKEFSKMVRKAKRKHARTNQIKLLETQRRNPNAFWQYIKNLGTAPRATLPNSVENNEGVLVEDPTLVREEWKAYFEKLLNPEVCALSPNTLADNPQRIAQVSENSLEFLNEEISLEEVRTAVQLNKDSKSPGVDDIRPPFLKNEGCIEFCILCLTSALEQVLYLMHGQRQSLNPFQNSRVPQYAHLTTEVSHYSLS